MASLRIVLLDTEPETTSFARMKQTSVNDFLTDLGNEAERAQSTATVSRKQTRLELLVYRLFKPE